MEKERCSFETAVFQNTAHSTMGMFGCCGLKCRLDSQSLHFFFYKICSGKETVSWQLISRTHKSDTVQAKATAVEAKAGASLQINLKLHLRGRARKGEGGGRERVKFLMENSMCDKVAHRRAN